MKCFIEWEVHSTTKCDSEYIYEIITNILCKDDKRKVSASWKYSERRKKKFRLGNNKEVWGGGYMA